MTVYIGGRDDFLFLLSLIDFAYLQNLTEVTFSALQGKNN